MALFQSVLEGRIVGKNSKLVFPRYHVEETEAEGKGVFWCWVEIIVASSKDLFLL